MGEPVNSIEDLLSHQFLINGKNQNYLDVRFEIDNFKKWRKKALEFSHPDKHLDNKDKWTTIFQELDKYKEVVALGPPEVHTFTHEYKAEKKVGDNTYIKTIPIDYGAPLPSIKYEFQNYIKHKYQLSDPQLKDINEKYKQCILNMPIKIIAAYPANVLNSFFSSTKALENELLNLIDDPETKAEVLKNFQDLLKTRVRYDSFDTDITKRHALYLNLITKCFQNNGVNQKMLAVYMNLAKQQKTLSYGTSIKKTFASLLINILRVMASLPVWTFALTFFASLLCPILIPLVWMDSTATMVIAAPHIIAISIGIINWALLLSPPTSLTNFGHYLEENLRAPLSNAIDNIVEVIFGVKLRALNLTEILDLNEKQDCKPKAPSPSFSSDCINELNDDNDTGEQLQLTFK